MKSSAMTVFRLLCCMVNIWKECLNRLRLLQKCPEPAGKSWESFNQVNHGSDNPKDAEKWWDDYGKEGNA